MTAKSAIKWMNEEGFIATWFVPQNNVNVGMRYHRRPVGNSPKFVPLDNSLNADVKRAHDGHVDLTMNLPKYDS